MTESAFFLHQTLLFPVNIHVDTKPTCDDTFVTHRQPSILVSTSKSCSVFLQQLLFGEIMMNMKKRLLISCAAFGLVSMTLLAGAQERPGSDCKAQTNMQDCRQEKMAEFHAKHVAKLHDSLKITAAQEPAWKTFTDSMHPQEAMMPPAKMSHEEMEKMSAPDRLEKHLAMQQKHLEMMQTHLAALKAFYAVLTPEQQKVMNKEVVRMEHQHHGKMGHEGHWGTKSDQTPPAAAK